MTAQTYQLWLAVAVNAGVVLVTLVRVGAFIGRLENRLEQLERRAADLEKAIREWHGKV